MFGGGNVSDSPRRPEGLYLMYALAADEGTMSPPGFAGHKVPLDQHVEEGVFFQQRERYHQHQHQHQHQQPQQPQGQEQVEQDQGKFKQQQKPELRPRPAQKPRQAFINCTELSFLDPAGSTMTLAQRRSAARRQEQGRGEIAEAPLHSSRSAVPGLKPCPGGCSCHLCSLPPAAPQDPREKQTLLEALEPAAGSDMQDLCLSRLLPPRAEALVAEEAGHAQAEPLLMSTPAPTGKATSEAPAGSLDDRRPVGHLCSRLASLAEQAEQSSASRVKGSARPGPRDPWSAPSAAAGAKRKELSPSPQWQAVAYPGQAGTRQQDTEGQSSSESGSSENSKGSPHAAWRRARVGVAPGASLVPARSCAVSLLGSSSSSFASASGPSLFGNPLLKPVWASPPELTELSTMGDISWLAGLSGDITSPQSLSAGELVKLRTWLGGPAHGMQASGSVEGRDGAAADAVRAAVVKASAAADSCDGPVDTRLKRRLLALAEAIATGDDVLASIFNRLLSADSSPMGSPMQRICHYVLKALAMRQSGEGMQSPSVAVEKHAEAALVFGQKVPYVEFWLTGMSCALVEAAAGRSRVHIVDFGFWIPQWPMVFRQLKSQHDQQHQNAIAGAHLQIRFTAVELPPDAPRCMGPMSTGVELGQVLEAAAAGLGISLHYETFQSTLQQFSPSVLGGAWKQQRWGGETGETGGRGQGEGDSGERGALLVCLSSDFDSLPDSNVLRSNPRDTFLKKIAAMQPDVVTFGFLETDFNIPFFLKRFEAVLNFHAQYFQTFDVAGPRSDAARQALEEQVVVKGLTNLVACDGALVSMRCEGMKKLAKRMTHCGLQPFPQTSHAAAVMQSMLARYPKGFFIRPCCKGGGAILSWHGQDLASYSAWKPLAV